ETLAGLEELRDIIDLAGRDPGRSVELGGVVTANLPAAIPLLMFATTASALTYSPAAADAASRPPTPGEPTTAEPIAMQPAMVPNEGETTVQADTPAVYPVGAKPVAEPACATLPAADTDGPPVTTSE